MQTKLPAVGMDAYAVYYETYAPKLWGIILMANLPMARSEHILMHTLTKAWQQRHEHPFTTKHFLTRLLHLAYIEGLPYAPVTTRLRPFLGATC